MCVVGVKKKTFMRVLRFAGTEDFISISGQKFSKRDQWLKLLFYIIFFFSGSTLSL